MARFYGEVGYGNAVETPPGSGNWIEQITEVPYRGDVIRHTRRMEPGDKVNSDISLSDSISIVADQFAIEHFAKIKYVRWMGVRWAVDTIQVQRPRLILNLGSVYNGPTQ